MCVCVCVCVCVCLPVSLCQCVFLSIFLFNFPDGAVYLVVAQMGEYAEGLASFASALRINTAYCKPQQQQQQQGKQGKKRAQKGASASV